MKPVESEAIDSRSHPYRSEIVSSWLTHPIVLGLWSSSAAFGAYAAMYGFRKPFTAATFDSDPFSPGQKAGLILAQVLGYTLSKFIGVRFVSSLDTKYRALAVLLLVCFAELALLGFAVAPTSIGFFFLFLNGLPLGMVFGLVLGFLEGRRMTEAFISGLCASFIVADGVTKSVGAWLLGQGVTDQWMPAAAGGLFLIPLIGFVWMLQQIPHPVAADIAARSERAPMKSEDQRNWLKRHGPPLALITIAYLLLTVLRSLRADFAPELWKALGIEGKPSVFTQSELWVAFGVLLINGCVVCIRSHRKAFLFAILTSIAGLAMVAAVSLAQPKQMLSPLIYMILLGLGLYLPYVAVHTTLFERWIALTRDKGTISFPMYIVDALGYLGYVGVLIAKGALPATKNPLALFHNIALGSAALALIAFITAGHWVLHRASTQEKGSVR